MKKVALIFGITGQDGSHLAEYLLRKGYEVHGGVRPTSTTNRQRIDHIFNTPEKREKYLHYGDMTDVFSILRILKKVQPDEIYNLAAQSHVAISWDIPYYTAQTTGIGVLNLLESVRFLGLKSKIYQASTSELFSGKEGEAPQNEDTPFNPQSPYGTAKLYGLHIARNYRDAYGMFVCNGILFNHEGPRRGDNFVTKKIVNAAKSDGVVRLGNLDAKRDWGSSKEYMQMAWMMMQQDMPDDYVVATGEAHSIREFISWVEEETGRKLKVIIDKKFVRPQDVSHLCGNSKKAKRDLGWHPRIKGKKLVKEML